MPCYYHGQEYSSGAIVCQEGKKYRCRGDEWYETGEPCGGRIGTSTDLVDHAAWFKSLPEQEPPTENNSVVVLNVERWALSNSLYRNGNELHGKMAMSKGSACGNQGNPFEFFYIEDVFSMREERCSDGFIRVVHIIARPAG
jgi:hypothetical protein